ncbi:LysM domain-containing protein, partial [Georgenia sp. 10Sc9-8]|nr:LysM domain-containing protein [Georgenia halotolerans]
TAPTAPADPGRSSSPGYDRPSGDKAGRQDAADGADRPDCHYRVVPGDTLWSIAAAHLPPGASDAEVAAEWPRWYAANTDVLGDDPHLIHPGQLLAAPEGQPS